jgi:hypothetical protein
METPVSLLPFCFHCYEEAFVFIVALTREYNNDAPFNCCVTGESWYVTICLCWDVGAAIWWYYILGYHFSYLYTSFVNFLLMNMCIKYFFYAAKLFSMLLCFLIYSVGYISVSPVFDTWSEHPELSLLLRLPCVSPMRQEGGVATVNKTVWIWRRPINSRKMFKSSL